MSPLTTATDRRRRILVALVTSGALLSGAAGAGAAPVVDGEFALPGPPRHLTTGPDGNVWAAIGGGGDVARITPAGAVTPFDPATVAAPVGIAKDLDGRLWVTQGGGVARFLPVDPDAAEAFPITGLTDPRAIVLGPDGNLWTASNDKVFRIPPGDPATFTAFTVNGLSARGITAGTDGHLWVADFGTGSDDGRLIRVATDGTFVAIPTAGGLQEVAAGPAGQVVFTDAVSTPHRLGRLTFGGAVEPTPVPLGDPFGITLGTDGAYWTARFGTHDLGRLTPDGQHTVLGGLSAASGPRFLTAGPGNTLWVGLEVAEKVARVTGVDPPAPVGGGGTGGGGTGGGGTGGSGGEPIGGGGTATPPDVTAPKLSAVRLTRARFAAGRRLAAPAKGRPGVGTQVRLTLGEDAVVRVVVERGLAGRRSGKSCVAPRAALRRRKACTRFRAVTTLRASRLAGARAVDVTGRVGGRSLPTGSYRLRITATDGAGNVSREVRLAGTIVRR